MDAGELKEDKGIALSNSHLERAAESPGAIVGLRAVVVHEDSTEAAIAEEGAAEFPLGLISVGWIDATVMALYHNVGASLVDARARERWVTYAGLVKRRPYKGFIWCSRQSRAGGLPTAVNRLAFQVHGENPPAVTRQGPKRRRIFTVNLEREPIYGGGQPACA